MKTIRLSTQNNIISSEEWIQAHDSDLYTTAEAESQLRGSSPVTAFLPIWSLSYYMSAICAIKGANHLYL